jgi:hypothetical protein
MERCLYLLTTWRGAPDSTAREHATVAWTEAVTLLANQRMSSASPTRCPTRWTRRCPRRRDDTSVTWNTWIRRWRRLAISIRKTLGHGSRDQQHPCTEAYGSHSWRRLPTERRAASQLSAHAQRRSYPTFHASPARVSRTNLPRHTRAVSENDRSLCLVSVKEIVRPCGWSERHAL